MKITNVVSAIVLAAAASFVSAAEDVYRSVMPNGQVIYGESPAPGATQVHKVPPPAASGLEVLTLKEKHRNATPSPDRETGTVVVIPHPHRLSPKPAVQGELQIKPETLPQRSY